MANITDKEVLQTRIGLKYDSYEKWTTAPGKDLVLNRGEVGFCAIGETAATGSGEATTAPTVLFKVGNGTAKFSELKWVSGLAADVYAWAKKATPDWTDFPALPLTIVDPDAATKKFVTKIEYADNTLTVTRSDVDWTDVKNAPDFALKSDLPTELGVMSVAGKEAIVATGDKDVEVSLKIADTNTVELTQDATNGLTAEVKVSATQGEGVTVTKESDGIKVAIDLTEVPGFSDNDTKTTVVGHNAIYVVDADPSSQVDGFDITRKVGLTLKDGKTVNLEQSADGLTAEVIVDNSGNVKFELGDDGLKGNVDLSHSHDSQYKVIQTAVSDPTANGNATEFIATISQDAQGVITATKKKITAADLGLESAMHFVGALTEAPATAKAGDVYLNTATKKEYVYDTTNGWIELGDEGSHALKSITVTGNEGLEGGGDLTQNRTIGIANGGVTTEKIADGSVTETKLGTEVQTKLNKEWATVEQGKTADSALQKINAGKGIAVTEKANNEQTVSHGAIEGAEAKEHGDYSEDDRNVILGFETDEFGHVIGAKAGEVYHEWYTNGDDAWLMLHVGDSSPSTIQIKGATVEDQALVIPAAPVGTGEAAIASVTDGVVTIKGGAKLDDHTLGNNDAADVTLAKVATTAKCEDLVDFEESVDARITRILYIDCGTATEVI